MKIPTRVRVGRKWYEVKRKEFKQQAHRWGYWTWRKEGHGDILVRPGRPMKQQHETYLHELTHAILWDMGWVSLCKDEAFVTAFAKKMNNALHSAEFE